MVIEDEKQNNPVVDTDQRAYLELATLNCIEIEALVNLHIDGELHPGLQTRFQSHLDSCTECQQLLDDCQGLIAIAAELRKEPMPEEVRQRLRIALKDRVGYDAENSRPRLKLIKSSGSRSADS